MEDVLHIFTFKYTFVQPLPTRLAGRSPRTSFVAVLIHVHLPAVPFHAQCQPGSGAGLGVRGCRSRCTRSSCASPGHTMKIRRGTLSPWVRAPRRHVRAMPRNRTSSAAPLRMRCTRGISDAANVTRSVSSRGCCSVITTGASRGRHSHRRACAATSDRDPVNGHPACPHGRIALSITRCMHTLWCHPDGNAPLISQCDSVRHIAHCIVRPPSRMLFVCAMPCASMQSRQYRWPQRVSTTNRGSSWHMMHRRSSTALVCGARRGRSGGGLRASSLAERRLCTPTMAVRRHSLCELLTPIV